MPYEKNQTLFYKRIYASINPVPEYICSPEKKRGPGGFFSGAKSLVQRPLGIAVPVHCIDLITPVSSAPVGGKHDMQSIRAPAGVAVLALGGKLDKVVAVGIYNRDLEHALDLTGHQDLVPVRQGPPAGRCIAALESEPSHVQAVGTHDKHVGIACPVAPESDFLAVGRPRGLRVGGIAESEPLKFGLAGAQKIYLLVAAEPA